MQQFLEIEHGGDFPSQVEQGRQKVGVGHHAGAALQTRIERFFWEVISHQGLEWPTAGGHANYTGLGMDPLSLPLDYTVIERILPHRYPFLLVDRVTELEPDKRIVGIKNVSLNERYLSHQPGERPALPPTILTECIAQVGAILILSKAENRGRIPLFRGIERVRFRRPVYAGDVVEIEARVKSLRSRVGQLHGFARVNGRVVVDGTMTFALGPTARSTPEETLR